MPPNTRKRAAASRLTAHREGDDAVMSVRDSGIGIPIDVLPRVFDLFAQADRTYQRAQGGLGIGLTLVRTLVELHGGSVAAKSEGVGRGSEFIVRLPVGVDGAESARPPSRRERRVFAVAPHTRRRRQPRRGREPRAPARKDLAPTCARPATVRRRSTSSKRIGRRSMLLDIGMPGMDGLEVARRARQTPESRDLTLIALTGWGQEEDRRRSREAGIDYHLVKPVDLEELGQLLTAVGPARAIRGRAAGLSR